jgi:hypothetical protein
MRHGRLHWYTREELSERQRALNDGERVNTAPNPPIPLLDEHKVDMITGWRKERQDTPFRRWQSRQANKIRNWITQETVNDSASSLKIYRAPIIKGINDDIEEETSKPSRTERLEGRSSPIDAAGAREAERVHGE